MFLAEREGKESGEESKRWGRAGGQETSSRVAGAMPTARSAARLWQREGRCGVGRARHWGRLVPGEERSFAGQGEREAAMGAEQGTDEKIAGEERSRAGVALPGWSRREMRRRGWSRPVLQRDEGSGGAGPDGRRPRGAVAAEPSSAGQTRVSWPGPVRVGRAGPDLSPETHTHTPARPPPGFASRLSRRLTASPS